MIVGEENIGIVIGHGVENQPGVTISSSAAIEDVVYEKTKHDTEDDSDSNLSSSNEEEVHQAIVEML